MSKYSIDSTTLTSIGNAIRGKEGSSALIPVSDFATRITNLPSGGGGGGGYFTQNVVKITQEKRYGKELNATNSFATFMEDPAYEYLKNSIQKFHNINIEEYNHNYSVYTCLYFCFTANEPAPSDISISFVDPTGATISIVNNGSFIYDENNSKRIYYYMLRRTGGSYDANYGFQSYQLNININNIDTNNKPFVFLGMFNFLKNNQYNFEDFEIIPVETKTGLIKEIFENPPVQQIFPAGLLIKPVNSSDNLRGVRIVNPLFERLIYDTMRGYMGFVFFDHLNGPINDTYDSQNYYCFSFSWNRCHIIIFDYMLNKKAGLCQDHNYSLEYSYFNNPTEQFFNDITKKAIVFYFNFEGESNRRERT